MADINELRLRARLTEQRALAVRATAPVEQILMFGGQPTDARRVELEESGWTATGEGTVWGGAEPWAWFRIRFRVPNEWRDGPVRLNMPLGGQGMLYLDGAPWQGLDPNHRTVTLPAACFDGATHLAAIECYAAAGTTAPRGPQERFALGACRLELVDPDLEGYYYDLVVGTDALHVLPESLPERAQLLELLLEAENLVNRRHPGSDALVASVRAARALLAERLPRLAAQSAPGRPHVVAFGHAHIDTAWLWPLIQTRRKVARSWSTVLRLMERFPDYYFLGSQPQQYRWMEEDEPEIYQQALERVKEGRWEPTGALWVEPDGNLPSGESWVRQLIYGQRYFLEHFGRRAHVVWLPDSFGYSAALPQLMKSAGVHTIVTSKLSWNTTNRMPHDTFRWRGLDGTEVMSFFITAAEDYRVEDWVTAPIETIRGIATYNGHMTAPELVSAWVRYRDKALGNAVIYPFGWGDGGGGPTEEMLEFARRVTDYPGLPTVKQGPLEPFLADTLERVWDNPRLAVWEGELYLEYHRGTYTSQAGVKWGNRRAEHALHDAELWASWATLLGGNGAAWRERLTRAWEIALRNQFHDILPGSSVAEVYVDQRLEHAEVLSLAASVREEAQRTLGERVASQGRALALFSSLPWERGGPIALSGNPATGASLQGADGQPLAVQETRDNEDQPILLVDGALIPALGVAVLPLGAGRSDAAARELWVSERALENSALRLEFDDRGNIASLFDKRYSREVLAPGGGGNQLLAFEDKPISYDAWDIDQYYVEKATPIDMVDNWQVIEQGPVRAGVEITRSWEGCTIRQRIFLYAGSPRVELQSYVDWHLRQVLLKTAFPLAVHSTQADYECAFGYVQRPTHRNTSWDAARFEVSGHRWVDLSETGYGVSLINDGKYGHDCLGTVLRLTLLKSAIDPDPLADEGEHHFSYALLPHGPEWSIADTVREAYAFNLPVHALPVHAQQRGSAGLPASLITSVSDHAVVDTVKPAENGDGVIVRVYECANRRGPVTLRFAYSLAAAQPVTILEDRDDAAEAVVASDRELRFDLLPFQVRSFRVHLRV
jgi:alpha-mannosidase